MQDTIREIVGLQFDHSNPRQDSHPRGPDGYEELRNLGTRLRQNIDTLGALCRERVKALS